VTDSEGAVAGRWPGAIAPGRLSPADAEPELRDSLLAQYRRFLERSHPDWGHRQLAALARQAGSGSLTLSLWRSSSPHATGLVWTQEVPAGACLHGVWIEPGGSETLEALLSDLEAEGTRVVEAVTDVLPEIDAPEQDHLFERRGFWHRAKVLMRREVTVPMGSATGTSQVRGIRRDDLPEIVEIYARAYSYRPGEFWTWTAPDSHAEAVRDVMGHLDQAGQWAPSFLPEASFVYEHEGWLLGAVLVERSHDGAAYVEDLVVDPAHHRQGIGRSLLERAIAEVTQDRPQAIELGAIRFGAPYRLYTRLGFVELPPPRGRLDGHWIRGESPF
jgi:GNAT superfamily N-acetyltransferase